MSRYATHPNYGSGARISPRAEIVLDPCAGDAADSLENQRFVTSAPYYSTVRFRADRTEDDAGGPYDWTLANPGPRGRRAFGYAVGDDMVPAGFLAGDGQATYSETNLQTRNQTIGDTIVEILGICILWHQAAPVVVPEVGVRYRQPDYAFLSALERSMSVEFGLNGDAQTIRLGTMAMIPGAGGLAGGAPFSAGLPFLDGAQNEPFAGNGWQTKGNFFRLPEGMRWMPNNQADGTLNVIFQQQHDVIIPSGGTPENRPLGTDQAAIASVSGGYNYPTELVIDAKVYLVGQQTGARSRTL